MRLVFQQRLGVSPAQYRASFRHSDANGTAAAGSGVRSRAAQP
jgi:hypothetical protein